MRRPLIIALFFLLLGFTMSLADVPRTLSYQGILKDAEGVIVPDGDYQLTFRIYEVSSSGSELWTEVQALPVVDGVFNAILGSVTLMDLPFDTAYWLGVQVETEPELVPRVAITSAAYAMRAAVSEALAGDVPADEDWTIDGDDIYRLAGRMGIGTYPNNAPAPRRSTGDRTPLLAKIQVAGENEGLVVIMDETNADRNQRAAVYAQRVSSVNNPGDDFSVMQSNNAVTGYNEYGDSYTFGVAGYTWFDEPHTAGVLGAHFDASCWAALGYLDSDLNSWGLYTQNDSYVGGEMTLLGLRMPTGASSGYVLTSNDFGHASWQVPAGGSDSDWIINGNDMYAGITGKVGIGNPSPTTKLAVDGMLRIEDVVWPTTGRGMEMGYHPDFHKGYIQVFDRDTQEWGNLYLGGGNVGIGVTWPSEMLQVNGVIYSSSGGIKYPDGTVQTTAAGGAGGGLVLPYAGSASSSGPAFSATNLGSGGAVLGSTASGFESYGVRGENIDGPGLRGESLNSHGVYGSSTSGNGLLGFSSNGHGVEAGTYAGMGVTGYTFGSAGTAGVEGSRGGNQKGYLAYLDEGGEEYSVYGYSVASPGIAMYGLAHSHSEECIAVRGLKRNPNSTDQYCLGELGSWMGTRYTGVYGVSTYYDYPYGYAGFFAGDVEVTGNLIKPAGSFKIDHPLDPTGKNLSHSFVESPDMMNIYNGNAILDETGSAWIDLPDWFEALNKDYRYQLTCIGGHAPVYIAEKFNAGRFKIAGGTPNLEVSWMVTGIRHDPYAERHRIPVEEEKPTEQQGKYLHPEVYDMPAASGIYFQSGGGFARDGSND